MKNVFHSTTYPVHATLQGCDVKTWLAAALAQPSTARAFETLAGNPKRRSQMGLMLPTARTLRDLYKTEIAAVASGRNFMASKLVWIWATIQAPDLRSGRSAEPLWQGATRQPRAARST